MQSTTHSSQVFLGQKNSIAKYDLNENKPIWSKEIKGTPLILSTWKDMLLIQIQTWVSYTHMLVKQENGQTVWETNSVYGFITPHYLKGDIYFFNHKREICKIDGDTGELLFSIRVASIFSRHLFKIAIIEDRLYLISKKKTFLINIETGEPLEIKELNKFTKHDVSVALGNGVDQTALFSNIEHASSSSGSEGVVAGGGDGGGGGE